ncbi:MAG: 50S ribosomal protein L1 [Candidatus Thermoplasmatota archaeon]|jgi:large subunit ribosomal protein L1|nr:50S ribosomal protein L1 [Candidatus Thermoplasmatota archaeon]MCL5964029.1 50S ribosomal protein L1 [Candidatus Thermoplasmatota archaeon]
MFNLNKESIKSLLVEERKGFTESIELAINLKDIDMANAKNRIDADIILPKGKGRESKIAIFATGELALRSKGAIENIITPETMDEIFSNKRKSVKYIRGIDFFLAEASMMPTIGKKLGIYLGPRNKMPRPLPPTVDPTIIVSNLKKTVRVRSKDKATFHVPIGNVTMSEEDILENIDAVIKVIVSKLEHGILNIRSVYVKKTMGKSYKVIG